MAGNNEIQLVEHKKALLKKALVEAMHKTLGNVTESCKRCNCDRTTFYRYYNDDEEFQVACNQADDMSLDLAESSLKEQIRDKVPSSTIFYLKTKGKRRGYIERHEVSFPDAIEIKIKTPDDTEAENLA